MRHSPVGNMHDVNIGAALEQLAHEMRKRARSGRRVAKQAGWDLARLTNSRRLRAALSGEPTSTNGDAPIIPIGAQALRDQTAILG